MISFRLDPKSGVPPYIQVANQVRHALRLGLLDRGDQLPTVKEVVTQLAINANTVLKAYRELEREGLVEGRAGLGTFVLQRPHGPAPATLLSLRRSLDKWIQSAMGSGLDPESIDALFRTGLIDAQSVGAGGPRSGTIATPVDGAGTDEAVG
jgi:GntR family transcriptional regulator